jgi:hypothetical protein
MEAHMSLEDPEPAKPDDPIAHFSSMFSASSTASAMSSNTSEASFAYTDTRSGIGSLVSDYTDSTLSALSIDDNIVNEGDMFSYKGNSAMAMADGADSDAE